MSTIRYFKPEKETQEAPLEWSDQDAWLLPIHGTELKVLYAFFPKEYLASVNSPFMGKNKRAVVLESEPFNLKPAIGRKKSLKAIMALINWLKTEEAEVNNTFMRDLRHFQRAQNDPE